MKDRGWSAWVLAVWGVAAILAGCSRSGQQPTREKFNDSWHFLRLEAGDVDSYFHEPGYDDSGWEVVRLPHTARIEPLVVNDQWQGTCWYRKRFAVPSLRKGQRIWLKFDGAMNVADVWLNGEHVTGHLGGYLPFVADLSEGIRYGKENVVAVRLDNTDNPVTGPKPLKQLDFNMYGGLYRNAWLIVKPPMHITDPILAAREGGGGIFVTNPEVSRERAVIAVKTHVMNRGSGEDRFRIRHELSYGNTLVADHEGEEVVLGPGGDSHLTARMEVKEPELWSPSDPRLYRLVTILLSGRRELERDTLMTGIKLVEFDGQQLMLNGEPAFLRGVNRHQEYPYIGYALSDQAQERDARKIKEAGFDYVRLSHYPHAPAFMEACDRLGILTIDAIPGWQYFSREPAFRSQVLQTARDMIRRDRNHASVLAWEVSLNESWMPEWFIDSLHGIAHSEYPGSRTYSAGWQAYGFDLYLQARQHRLHAPPYDGGKPYVVSEYGDWEYYAMNAGLNQDQWGDLMPEERSSRQLRGDGEIRLMQQARNIQEAHNSNFTTPAFADGYWVMFDYNRGYSDDLEASGIMDIFRIPKPSYHFFRSQRSAGGPGGSPVLEIPHTEPLGEEGLIRIFSNCEEVELLVDGKAAGRQGPDRDRFSDHLAHPPFTFRVGKEAFHVLEAKGYLSGDEVVVTERRVAGEAVKIVLDADLSGVPLTAGARDHIFVYASLCDESGTVVPDGRKEVFFEVSGPARLTGTNPAPAEAGIAAILLEAGDEPGPVTIRATGSGLKAAVLEVQSVK